MTHGNNVLRPHPFFGVRNPEQAVRAIRATLAELQSEPNPDFDLNLDNFGTVDPKTGRRCGCLATHTLMHLAKRDIPAQYLRFPLHRARHLDVDVKTLEGFERAVDLACCHGEWLSLFHWCWGWLRTCRVFEHAGWDARALPTLHIRPANWQDPGHLKTLDEVAKTMADLRI